MTNHRVFRLFLSLICVFLLKSLPAQESGQYDDSPVPPSSPEVPDAPEAPVAPGSVPEPVPEGSTVTETVPDGTMPNTTDSPSGNQVLYRLTGFLNSPVLVRQGQGRFQDSGDIEDIVIAPGGEIEAYILNLRNMNGLRSGLYIAPSDSVNIQNGTARLDLAGIPNDPTYVRDPKLIRQFFPETSVQASRLLAFTVQGRDSDKLGSFEDIVLDMDENKVSYVVLTTSGILGIGKKYHAVPPTSIDFNPRSETAYVNISPDELDRKRGFDSEYWPVEPESEWDPITSVTPED